MEQLRRRIDALIVRVPADMQADYRLYCVRQNNHRLQTITLLNLLIQLSCYIICVYIYPATFPGRARLDPVSYTVLSTVYVLANIAFFWLFGRMKRRDEHKHFVRDSHILHAVFLLCYIAVESYQTGMEVGVAGNIFRFLSTYIIITSLPMLPWLQKAGLITLYSLFTGVWFSILARRGYEQMYRYQELEVLFYIASVAIAFGSQGGAIRTFLLQQNLINANRQFRVANAELERMSSTDPLTQIPNRRAFDDYISRAWSACRRDGSSLTVFMIDIDDFKRYNDRFGHQMGDICLTRVAQCIKTHFCRESDMVARYGGEEFVALTIKNTPADALALAEKVRADVEALGIARANDDARPYVTISLGVVTCKGDRDIGHHHVVKMADDALYRAKQAGKNCVVMEDGRMAEPKTDVAAGSVICN